MRTSLIMSTYNGEDYIEEQLYSIINQTVQIDEVIIKDDCSSDKTVDIISDFIQEYGLSDHWRVICNKENLGWKRNFIEGMKMTSNDIVFLCDQDDIWYRDKVEASLKCFENPEVKLLVTDFESFADEEGVSTYVFHPKLGKGELSRVPCDIHFKDIRRPGCTYSFRRELLIYLDDLWFEGWPHDSYLWTVAIVKNGLYSLNRPTVHYRRHEGNNTPANEKSQQRRVEILEFKTKIANLVLDNKELLGISEQNIKNILRAKDFYGKRINSIKKGNFFVFFRMLFRIGDYPKPSSWAGDILASRNN